MTFLKDIIFRLEEFAPLSIQEDYDNCGLILGDKNQQVNRILACLDCTEKTVDEAIAKNCELILCHHPIIFKGLKKITNSDSVGRTLMKAMRHNISIYASHTNLDKVPGGVNFKIAEKIGLKNVEILAKESGKLSKLVVFVPVEFSNKVTSAMFDAGAGKIGNYSECSFQLQGIGTFTPNEKANPTIGRKLIPESVDEVRIEVMLPDHKINEVIKAMKSAHPYEEVAFYLQKIENENQEIGLGVFGEFENEITEDELICLIKKVFKTPFVKHTQKTNKHLKTMALCGGSGSSLLNHAISKQVDCFLTSDTKYHDFFNVEDRLLYIDIGHFETEQFTIEIFCAVLSNYFPNIAVILTETVTNPVNYA
ncbi:MAG: Nif3-like dinuclear metal center hexameric protein [Cytophagales bacterium]